MQDAINIYPNIKRLCKRKGVRIGELEKRIGVSAGYFSRVTSTHGEKCIGIDKVISVANELGVDLTDLLLPPPEITNADVFREVFGIKPILLTNSWWCSPYVKPADIESEVEE